MAVRRVIDVPRRAPLIGRLRELFTRLHWGDAPGALYQTLDLSFPHLVQMGALEAVDIIGADGELVEVTYPQGSHLGIEYDWEALETFPDVDEVFNPARIQRIWLVSSPLPGLADVVRRSETVTLDWLNRRVGGIQSQHAWPFGVRVLPIGEAFSITYGTHKQGDDPASSYKHVFADERNGVRPWFAADERGRTFLVGGSYTVPPEGIRN